MADTSVLKGIYGDMNSDLIILPSSRHEVIILPLDMARTPDSMADMKAMVTEIKSSIDVPCLQIFKDKGQHIYRIHIQHFNIANVLLR